MVGYGESLTFESWKILRVPMTTSWLQRLVRGISLQEARSRSKPIFGWVESEAGWRAASWSGWPVRRDELGFRGE